MLHMSRKSLTNIHEAFIEEQDVSKDLQPAHPLDLYALDFYVQEFLKDNVYNTNPYILDKIRQLFEDMLMRLLQCKNVSQITSTSFYKNKNVNLTDKSDDQIIFLF